MTNEEKVKYQELKRQYQKIHQEMIKLNAFADLPNMSPKQFGETWSEGYIRSKCPNLVKANGKGHDFCGKNYNTVEAKSCRKKFTDPKWTINQVHPNPDESEAHLLVWYDCDEGTSEKCLIPTTELMKCTMSRQHTRTGADCFTISSSAHNREILKKYLVHSWDELNEKV